MFKIDSRLQKTWLWLTIGIVLLSAITALSLISMEGMPMPGNIDKLYHAVSYAVLMGWWVQLFPRREDRLMLVLAFILFGGLIEVLQSFHPLRHFDLLDMAANTTGILVSWVLGWTRFDQILYWLDSKI
jgi:VanZ family protein